MRPSLREFEPSIVETSPASTPASLALRKRRRILPERVLGSDATNSSELGVAIGPSSRRTCSIRAAASASEGTWSERTCTKALIDLALQGIGNADGGGFGHGGMRDQRALDLGGADAVSGDVEHVIGAAQHGDVSVFVFHGHVAGDVAAGEESASRVRSARGRARRCAACRGRDA